MQDTGARVSSPALEGIGEVHGAWHGGVAVPAQPADFQAEAESDTRIQLSWLLPPQERIIKYELVYWAAEDEGQQVSAQRGQEKGGGGSSLSLRVCGGLTQAGFLDFVVVRTRPPGFSLGLWGSRG